MSSFERYLAESNSQVLHKHAAGGFMVEVVDRNLTPTVVVSKAGKSSEFPLEKIGLFWADETGKFYSEASGDEVKASEFADLAIEAHLFHLDGLGEGK